MQLYELYVYGLCYCLAAMSDQGETIETVAELPKSEPELKKVPDDIGDVLANSVKEPEEAEHQAECHILKQARTQHGQEQLADGDEQRAEEGVKEKGELDAASESEKKDEEEGWLYVLGHNLLKKRVGTLACTQLIKISSLLELYDIIT